MSPPRAADAGPGPSASGSGAGSVGGSGAGSVGGSGAGSVGGSGAGTAGRPGASSRVAVLVVAVLTVDAVLLAWTELAWLSLRVGAVPLPVSALVAAVTTPLLVLAADAAVPRSRAPLFPLVAWTLTVVVAGLWSPAGGGVLPPDWRALLLLAAGILPGVLAAVRTSPAPSR